MGETLKNQKALLDTLYTKMAEINPGIAELEPYEFRYCMHPWHPQAGWDTVQVPPAANIEAMINTPEFYESIQMKPGKNGAIVLDKLIVQLNRMLMAGLANGSYSSAWVKRFFYLDIRGFYFLPRTLYFTAEVLAHLGGKPYRQFEPKQQELARVQDIGYKQFREANAEVDALFIDSVKKLIKAKGTPVVLAIAGPTAAGKTEMVERLHAAFAADGQRTTSIEMDNFLTDRDQREARGIHSLGAAAIHLDLFVQALADIRAGRQISIPRYDFIDATSSHDLAGNLKPGGSPILIEPADIIFIEGNFPFLLPEAAGQIDIKVVYLTSDEIRLKRKWKRDIDYRKKYEPTYFRNRYFQSQYPMAQKCYIPQLQVCDLAVDTSASALWAAPEIARLLDEELPL
jgi:uridine kinase